MRHRSRLLVAGFALLSHLTSAQSLPYNPTTIFLSPTNPNLAYIFLPSTSSPSTAELVSLNISSTIQSSNLTLETLTSDLPFLDGKNAGNQTAYIPSISSSGSLGVYAGQCTSGSSFWVFTPASDPASQSLGVGTWREMSVTASASASTSFLQNANFLASSFSFSTLVESNDTQRIVYAFGGMCPTATTSNSSTWQSSASYSNSLLKLAYGSQTSYGLSVSTSAGTVPIPEAGFTFTGLTPTFSNSSTGIVTQAQDFVLLGGHTSTAFINMSQIALFSLPQESWSYQSVDSASSKGSTELAIKSTATIVTPDSRSGHTAVLSTDGSSLVVFGGWVGDVATAAQPQLAVLRTGSGYGGSGNWAWELPSTTGTGLASGEGIYGHGAVMLPGNVMMVLGGNHIAVSSSTRLSKKSDSAPRVLFLNLTSMAWSSSYANPSYTSSAASATTSPGSGSTSNSGSSYAKNVGLGAGLGLGIAAVIGAICVYIWYSRRLKKRRREAREKDLNELSRSAADFYANSGTHTSMNQNQRDGWWSTYQSGEMSQRQGLMPLSVPTSSLGNRGMSGGSGGGCRPGPNTPDGSYGDYDEHIMRSMLPRSNSNRGGGSILRKPVNPRNARGYYQPAPSSSSNLSHSGFDFGSAHSRTNSLGTAGVIHPIYEADEDLDAIDAPNPQPSMDGDMGVGQAIEALESDPFVDPQPSIFIQPPRSNPGSRPGTGHGERNTPTPESSAREREREIKKWVADWAAADAIMNSRTQPITYSGRISPSKESGSGRTESSLSERSVATISALGLSRNSSTRNNSLTAFFSTGPSSWNPFVTFGNTSAGLGSITEHHVHSDGKRSPVSDRASVHGNIRGGPNPPPSSGSATSSSFTTAHTSQSFSALRNEGESLLSRPREEDGHDGEGSPSKRKATAFSRRRDQAGSWLGSLKRVFASNGSDEGESVSFASSGSARSSPTRGYRSESLSNSPTRADYGSVLLSADAAPRRTVSATATMWRRKQGKDGWLDSEGAESEASERRANTLTLEGSRSWRGGPSELGFGPVPGPVGDDGRVADEEEEDGEEWDIERAVERRVVQVMFTVPKEKLRVVNPGEGEGSDTASSRRPSEDEKATEEPRPVSAVDVVSGEPELEREKDRGGVERDGAEEEGRSRSAGSVASSGKGKGRVQEIVERLEGWMD